MIKGIALIISFLILSLLFPASAHSNNCHVHRARNFHDVHHRHIDTLVIGIPVAGVLDYYWSVGAEIREEEIVKKVTEKLQSKDEKQVAPSNPLEKFRLIPKKISAAALDKQVETIFRKHNCQTCHKPGQSVPSLKLFNEDGSLFTLHGVDNKRELSRRERIYEACNSGSMPKNGKSLSSSEIDVLDDWLYEIEKITKK